MLVVSSSDVDLVNDNQYNHSSDLYDPPCFYSAMYNTLPNWMSTTSYSAEHGVAELGFYLTLDIARTPNTSSHTLSYSTEHGFANQRADLNIDQGAGYTTPETSSLSVIIPIITT